jgi:hypothetical protein
MSLPSVLHLVNQLVTESRTLPSAALGRVFFAECPTKGTRQRVQHSVKPQISVVLAIGFASGINIRPTTYRHSFFSFFCDAYHQHSEVDSLKYRNFSQASSGRDVTNRITCIKRKLQVPWDRSSRRSISQCYWVFRHRFNI